LELHFASFFRRAQKARSRLAIEADQIGACAVSLTLAPSRAYGIGSARRTLYACPLPHAMKGYLRFVAEVMVRTDFTNK
jgi:hypothetical protein